MMGRLRQYTEADFRAWLDRDARRKELQREARQLQAENDVVAEDLLALFRADGKSSCRRGNCVAEIEVKPGTVSWKDEFLRAVGSEAATAIAAAVPSRESVKIREV